MPLEPLTTSNLMALERSGERFAYLGTPSEQRKTRAVNGPSPSSSPILGEGKSGRAGGTLRLTNGSPILAQLTYPAA